MAIKSNRFWSLCFKTKMADKIKTSFPGVNKGKIITAVKKFLPKNKVLPQEVSLIFVLPDKMAELNKKYRRLNKPTNVLSFDEGDVVICPAVAKEEAKNYGFTQKNWMTRLIVHGILHLTGYEHDTPQERLKMERLEDKILEEIVAGASQN